MRANLLEESCAVSPILGTSEFLFPYLKPPEVLCLGDRASLRAACVTPSSWAFWPGLWSHLGNLESERRAHKLLWLGCCHHAGTSLHLQSFFFFWGVVGGDKKHVSFLWTDVGLTVERSCRDSMSSFLCVAPQ